VRVEVTLLLTFKDKAPGGEQPFALELAPGTTVGQALESLSIPASAAKVVLNNGRVSGYGQKLKAGDRLTVFPPLEGG
jgi:sulfur carrier protein ThiS